MTPEDVARRTKRTVIKVGAAFGETDRFRARGESLGLSRWPFYFGGRAGVLGELGRLADLAEQVVAAAEPTGRPLFAAWRSLAVADEDPAARVALALLRLREHRGSSHLIAIHEHGLTPLRAILAGPGAGKARANGWREPWPSVPATDTMAIARAEPRTDELAAAPYAALAPSEREHFVRLLGRVHDACGRGRHKRE